MTDLPPIEPPRDHSEEDRQGIARLRAAFGGAMGGERPAETPAQVGPYKLLEELGRGGMGSVYKASDSRTAGRRIVALKLIRSSIAGEEIVARFEQERRVLAGLDHPNIARLYDADYTPDGRPYFVMEHIDGLPIDEYCDQHRVPITERLKMFSKVCSAVHHAHQNLIVHRDIKPANILVTPSGEPKLLDFGIAKLLNPNLASVEVITRTHLRIMTPEYASPEQVRGGSVNVQSDIYSLGVLLYELLCGRRPYRFQDRLQDEIVRIVCETEPDRPSTALTRDEVRQRTDGTTEVVTPKAVAMRRADRIESLRRHLSGDLDDIVLMAMEKSPERRYGSALQFAEDVRRYLDGHPVSARRTSARALYSARKFVKRNRLTVASCAAAGIVLLLSGSLTALQWRTASIANERAAEAAQAEAVAAQSQLDAERRAGAAEREVRFVSELASVLFDSSTSILNYDLSPTQREHYWRDVLDEFKRLIEATDERNTSVVYLVRGRAHRQLADSYGGTRAGNLGAFEAALPMYDLAIEDLTRAVEDPDVAPIGRSELVTALVEKANALRRLQRLGEAEAAYQDAMRIADTHLASSPDVDSARVVGGARFAYAQNLVQLGRFQEAERWMLAELEDRRARCDQHPEVLRYRRDLSVLLLNLGELQRELGRVSKASVHVDEAMSIRRELHAERSTNSTIRRDLALGLYAQALQHCGEGGSTAALDAADEACTLLDTLIVERPDDLRNYLTRAFGLAYVTSAAVGTGDMILGHRVRPRAVAAVDAYREQANLQEQDHPPAMLRDLEAWIALIDAEFALDDSSPQEAADRFAVARDRIAALLDEDRASVFLRKRLGDAWLGLADAYSRGDADPEHPRAARRALNEAERILNDVGETGLRVDQERLATVRARVEE